MHSMSEHGVAGGVGVAGGDNDAGGDDDADDAATGGGGAAGGVTASPPGVVREGRGVSAGAAGVAGAGDSTGTAVDGAASVDSGERWASEESPQATRLLANSSARAGTSKRRHDRRARQTSIAPPPTVLSNLTPSLRG